MSPAIIVAPHIALAAASKRISDLEARARLPLLVRHARGVTLTSAGHGLLLHARAVLSAMDRLGAELDDFQNGVAGVVSIYYVVRTGDSGAHAVWEGR